jgi:hypothetical protein
VEALDDQQLSLPIISCAIGKRRSPGVSKLIDKHIIKTKESDIWEHPWPPREKVLELVLVVASVTPVAHLRFWPNSLDDSKSVKDLMVTIAGSRSFDCELETRIATIVSIPDPVPPSDIAECLAVIHSFMEGARILDEYGEYPLLRFNKLEFVAWESHSKLGQFGLKRIRLFDLQGNIMDLEACEVSVVGCGSYGNLDILVPAKNQEYATEEQVWIGHFVAQKPQIFLTFTDQIAISGIEIENAGFVDDDDVACKYMQVFADGKSIWSGKLNRRPAGSSDTSRDSTFVFFLCSAQLQEKVRMRSTGHVCQ